MRSAIGRQASELFSSIAGNRRLDHPLARYTSLNVGGPADLFLEPADPQDLSLVLGIVSEEGLPFVVVGGGTNLLVQDGGFRGVVVHLRGPGFTQGPQMQPSDPWGPEGEAVCVRVGGALYLNRLSRWATSVGLSGLEPMIGIPGTVGGAVVMNAGTREGCVGALVRAVRLVDSGGGMRCSRGEEIEFGYRYARLPVRGVVVEAEITLHRCEHRKIEEKTSSLMSSRRLTQPLEYKSAGSIFKNPEGDFAGRLVECAGLKGTWEGGAQISEKHANFILNRDRATAGDIRRLMDRAKEAVFRQTGIELEEEIRMVGSNGAPPGGVS